MSLAVLTETEVAQRLADLGFRPPVTVIEFREGMSPIERSELSGGGDPTGADPFDVARSLCRGLGVGPGRLDVKAANARTGVDAQTWVYLDFEPVARVTGLSWAYLQVSLTVLADRNWKPGRNREPAQAAGDRVAGDSGQAAPCA